MPPADNVDPSLLESLEDSTSSSDIPKSKLDKVREFFFFYSISTDQIAKKMSCDHSGCYCTSTVLFPDLAFDKEKGQAYYASGFWIECLQNVV